MAKTNIFSKMAQEIKSKSAEIMEFSSYLDLCKTSHLAYATAPERMLAAIGEPILIDTSKDARLSRIFLNRTIRIYPAFKDFFGMEEVVERIVGYYRHAAQGLEERKQILYLLGPVGGGKSSLAERLKDLMAVNPIYILTDKDGNLCPDFETPLGLLGQLEDKSVIESEYGIPLRYIPSVIGPWTVKRLEEYDGDISQFKVTKMYPSRLKQIGIVKTEPGDDNNQDIASLVGKTNMRMLEHFNQNDPDSYLFSGALCRGNQGIVEFVEMFKAPIKMLHPMLTATQEGNYMGTQNISAIPFNGTILAHSNMSEWQKFKDNKDNEAFLDRVYVIKVPYCLRVTDEIEIYKKMISGSSLGSAPCVPETLKMLAKFFILTRLIEPENSNLYSKMNVYDGMNIKSEDPRAKSLSEYQNAAGVSEGMDGLSTRFAFKILSKTFNFDASEIAADPVHLMYILTETLKQEQLPDNLQDKYLNFIKEDLAPRYAQQLGKEIQKAYLESYSEYGQNLFDKYIAWADAWLDDIDYKDPDTGNLFDSVILNAELEKIEKAAQINNAKDFRHEVVQFVLRAKAEHGKHISWTSYEKLKEVIEKKMFSSTEDLLPIISFGAKGNKEDSRKHNEFVSRMEKLGYTTKQVRRLVEWFLRQQKSA